MAYNLQSVITILEHILDPQQTQCFAGKQKPQLQSLLRKASSLQQILERCSLPKIESLESRIRDLARRAEDIIESDMVDRMLSMPQGMSFVVLRPDVQQVMQELDSVTEQVVKLVELHGSKMESGASSSGASFSTSKSVVVGVEEDLVQLKDRLTGTRRKLEIIPIVGMGGIGKTTLARNLYEDPSITSHFKHRAWTTISQDYNMRAILLSLLRCIIGKETADKHIAKETDDLKDILYKSLFGRRYMIVLDDIWSADFWDEMRMYFPDNNNGSRIVVTTREANVAKHADPQSVQHQVQLLSNSESWDLLRQIVFGGDEDCRDELHEIGTKIASDCGGLPLAISVIGGLLSKIERSKEGWEKIGNDVTSAIFESDEHQQMSNILSLSYNHLSIHLKPCFLYMGAFPEDYEIKCSKLTRLWIAEGFVKSNGSRSLEEEAEDYLRALVERNLLVRKTKPNGQALSYSMHDLLRDVCVRKADEEKFLQVVKNSPDVISCNVHRASLHMYDGIEFDSLKLMAQTRSFLSPSLKRYGISAYFGSIFIPLRLLRVLDILVYDFTSFPEEVLQLVNLRYLALRFNFEIPREISRLWNLQTLITRTDLGGYVPSEIWEMSELRHLVVDGETEVKDKCMKRLVHQKKLKTISMVRLTPSLISADFFECIPNIEKLALIYGKSAFGVVVDLSHLHKLETLTFHGSVRRLPTTRFPSTIRKLKLQNCAFYPGALSSIYALPNLEVLNIVRCFFRMEEKYEWELAEGDEFRSLQFLFIEAKDTVRWKADETNFPKLRHLCLSSCLELEEIPSGIGEISTLQLIELINCPLPVEASARQILEVQQSEYDNYSLQLRVSGLP